MIPPSLLGDFDMCFLLRVLLKWLPLLPPESTNKLFLSTLEEQKPSVPSDMIQKIMRRINTLLSVTILIEWASATFWYTFVSVEVYLSSLCCCGVECVHLNPVSSFLKTIEVGTACTVLLIIPPYLSHATRVSIVCFYSLLC